jgi:GNAT superfamily N-acetyltransferase
MQSIVEIRKATRSDAQAAWEIRRRAVLTQCAGVYPIDQLQAWTSGQPGAAWADAVERGFYVALDGDQIVATGMLTTETGRIDAIFVLPSHMGRGVGKQIMTFLERLALKHGLGEICLESTLNAAPFYRSCGFSGDAVSIYRSPRGLSMDCVPMSKRLVALPF